MLAVGAVSLGGAAGAGATPERALKVSGDMAFPPYEFVDENGLATGYNVEMMRAVADVMDLTVEIRLGPWSEVRTELEEGNIDALTGMYYSAERDRLVDFTTAHIKVGHGLFVRRGSTIRGLEDLEAGIILVQRDDIMHDTVRRQDVGDVVAFETPARVLQELAGGLGDAALVGRLQGLYLRNTLGLSNLVHVGEPIGQREYCFAVREGDRDLLAALNEGLAILSATGRTREIRGQWFGSPTRWSLVRTVRHVLIFLALPALVVVAAFILWNRSLRRTVSQRTAELTEQLEERRRAERELTTSQQYNRMLFESSPIGLALCTLRGEIIDVNMSLAELLGRTAQELIGLHIDDLTPEEWRDTDRVALDAISRVDRAGPIEKELLRGDGSPVPVRVSASAIEREGERRILASVEDVSERVELEMRARRAERLQAIGQLAGGVAHDFNNILQAVFSHMELLERKIGAGEDVQRHLGAVRTAAERAADLTRQLLAFGRRQALNRETVELSERVREIAQLLVRLIGEDVFLELELCEEPLFVNVDPGSLEQVVVNLCVNARDALPDGGRVTVRTSVGFPSLSAGDTSELDGHEPCAVLEVSDGGVGMDAEICEHIFEPFFTTKEVGEGSGLGLATVYGVVRQHGGTVHVESSPGEGSVFSVFLPMMAPSDTARVSDPVVLRSSVAGSTILVAEDEDEVRHVVVEILSEAGYRVIEAKDGAEAKVLIDRYATEIDMAVLDAVMPHCGGHEVWRRINEVCPGLPVLFSTGYSAHAVHQEYGLPRGVDLLMKPYSASDLLHRVQEALERPR